MINNFKVHGKMKVDETDGYTSTYGKFLSCEVGDVKLEDLFELLFKLKGEVVINIDVINNPTAKEDEITVAPF